MRSAATSAVAAGFQAQVVATPVDTAAALRRELPLTRAKSPLAQRVWLSGRTARDSTVAKLPAPLETFGLKVVEMLPLVA